MTTAPISEPKQVTLPDYLSAQILELENEKLRIDGAIRGFRDLLTQLEASANAAVKE